MVSGTFETLDPQTLPSRYPSFTPHTVKEPVAYMSQDTLLTCKRGSSMQPSGSSRMTSKSRAVSKWSSLMMVILIWPKSGTNGPTTHRPNCPGPWVSVTWDFEDNFTTFFNEVHCVLQRSNWVPATDRHMQLEISKVLTDSPGPKSITSSPQATWCLGNSEILYLKTGRVYRMPKE